MSSSNYSTDNNNINNTSNAYTYQQLDDVNDLNLNNHNDDDDIQQDNIGNAARDTVAQEFSIATFTTSPKIRIFRIIWNIGVMIPILILLIGGWNSSCKTANANLKFQIITISYLVGSLLLCIALLLKQYIYHPSWYRFVLQLVTCLGIIQLVQLAGTTLCSKTQPLYIFMVVILSIESFCAFFPLLLIILLICCLPCIIACLPRISSYLFSDLDETAATDEALELLSSFTYSPLTYNTGTDTYPAARSAITQPQCPICLMEYEDDDVLRRFQCQHDFHKDCIDNWLKTKAICPVCRISVFERDENRNIIGLRGTTTDSIHDNNNSNIHTHNDHNNDDVTVPISSNLNDSTGSIGGGEDQPLLQQPTSDNVGEYVAVTIPSRH